MLFKRDGETQIKKSVEKSHPKNRGGVGYMSVEVASWLGLKDLRTFLSNRRNNKDRGAGY